MSFSFKILPTCVIFFFQNTAYLSDCFSSKILPTCVIFPAARLLLSRIGGFKNGDRAAEKITQVGSILEEKTIAEVGSNLKEKK